MANSNKIDITSHTRNTGNAKNGTGTIGLSNGANINYTTVGGKTTWNVGGKDYTDAKEAVNAAKTLNAETAPAVNHAKGNFVDPSVLQDQMKNQQGGSNTNIANKWGNSAVKALDDYNKTYNNVTDEAGNKVQTSTTDALTGTPKVTRQATSTSTDEEGNFTSDYGDGSSSTTDIYGKTKVNKNYVDTNEEARRQAEAAAQAAQTEYTPEGEAYTQADASDPNGNLEAEYDKQYEELANEIINDEGKNSALETLASASGMELESDAADYDDIDSIVNKSTYTSRVINDEPFDWGDTREEPDYWEASRMWEQPAIYEKEIEEKEERDQGPLTNKRDRDTTRIGRHG